jgi:hypothetical protein
MTGKTVELGAYDLVMCGDSSDAEHNPDSMIYDAPSVYYEIRKRHAAVKSCRLKTVGDQFFTSGYGIGFPKNNHYSRAFSVAMQTVRLCLCDSASLFLSVWCICQCEAYAHYRCTTHDVTHKSCFYESCL